MSLYFKYHTRNADGEPKDGIIEARDEDDALIKLQEQGVIIISVEAIRPGPLEIIRKALAGILARIDQHSITKTCPYCPDEIRHGSVLCRFCGKDLTAQPVQSKWCFKTASIIIGFLCVGPLVLPLVWLNPRFNQKTRVILTATILILSLFLGALFISALKSLKQYYGSLL